MSRALKTRTATADDAVELAHLNSVSNHSKEPPETYIQRFNDPLRVDIPILAEVDGETAGFVNLRVLNPFFHDAPYAEITELFVLESHRRQGIASALIAQAEQIARENGARQLLVMTDFYNHSAQQTYRAAGFVHHDIALSKVLDKK